MANRKPITELLQQVLEHPDDDGARAVWADALTERGDPRGEFVALQLARSTAPKAVKRERSLFLKHWKQWVGPLAPQLQRTDLRFERGLLSECTYLYASRPKLQKVLGDPVWTTVTSLGLRDGRGHADVLDLLTHPTLRSLRRVIGLDASQLAELASRAEPLPWTDVTFQLSGREELPSPDRQRLTQGRALPALRTLGVDCEIWGRPYVPISELEWLLRGPLVSRLQTLRLATVGTLGEVRAAVDPLAVPRLEVLGYWESHFCTEPLGARYLFHRDARGKLRRLEVSWTPAHPLLYDSPSQVQEVADQLATLPGDALAELRVIVPGGLPTAPLEAAVRRLELERCEIVDGG